MKIANRNATSLILITVAVAASQNAGAAVVMTIGQQGSNVVLVGAGTLNTAALTLFADGFASASIQPNRSIFIGGTAFSLSYAYEGVSGPTGAGPGSVSYTADIAGGQIFGVAGGGSPPLLLVPKNYVSGSDLASNATFVGHSLASLGLAEGSYVWTWGSGATSDSLTVNVIPESSTALLVCLSFGSLLHRRNRNDRRSHAS